LKVRELTTFAKIVCGFLYAYNVPLEYMYGYISRLNWKDWDCSPAASSIFFHFIVHTHIILHNSAEIVEGSVTDRPGFFISFKKNSINVTETVCFTF